MQFKRSVILFIMTVLGSLAILLVALFIYDPLQLYHKPWGRKTTFHKDMRLQSAGIINNYPFDSMILGTSMTANTSSSEASEILGGSFVNISILSGALYERSLILDYTLRKKTLRKVIVSLEIATHLKAGKENEGYPIETFEFLYDANPFNDLQAYINANTLKCLFSCSENEECIGALEDFDRLSGWYGDKRVMARFGGLQNWFKTKNSKQVQKAIKQITKVTEKIEKGEYKAHDPNIIDNKTRMAITDINAYILATVIANKETEFILFFTPSSTMRLALLAQYNWPSFAVHTAIIRYMAEQGDRLPNLKVYAFGDQDFTDDIANYKDLNHYHPSVNHWILKAIRDDIGRIRSSNVDIYLQRVTEKSLHYDIVEIGEKIKTYLKKDK